MILYYPMIIAQSVSPNVVPGIVKATERFMLLYRMNDIMDKLSSGLPFDVTNISTQGGIITVDTPKPVKMKEDIDFQHLTEQRTTGTTGTKGTKGGPGGREPVVSTKFDLKNTDMKSIALEPTYTLVSLQGPEGSFTKLLGIKVLPMRSTTPEDKMMEMLTYDRYSGWLESKALKAGRWLVAKMVRKWANAPLPFSRRLKDIEPAGKVRKDVLLRKTTFGTKDRSNIFVVLNKVDVSDTFMQAGGVRKLQKLGWQNFIFTDDVNKSAYFCMQVLRGMCSEISFPMLYQTVMQREAYETVEEIRKTSASIFKKRVTFPKVVGENKMSIVDTYLENLNLLHEIEIIDESVASFMKNLKPEKFKQFLKATKKHFQMKDMSGIAAGLKKLNLPQVEEATLDRLKLKAPPAFRKSYRLAETVLSNTFTDANPTMIRAAAGVIALRTARSKGADVMKATKVAIKSFVRTVRRVMPKIKAPPEYILDLAIGWTAVVVAVTGIALILGVAAALVTPFIKAAGAGIGATGGSLGVIGVPGAFVAGAEAGVGAFVGAAAIPQMLQISITVALLVIITTIIVDRVKSRKGEHE